MEWVSRDDLTKYNLVDDFLELLKVFDSNELNEFYYDRLEENEDWKVKLY